MSTDHHHHHHGHSEEHFTSAEIVRDIVIGMSDGLTVPFALAAGLTGAISQTGIVVTAGLAEIAAGSIAMGLGGFLAARGDSEHYGSELRREWEEVERVPHIEEKEIEDALGEYGVTPEEAAPVVAALKRNPQAWVDFMMRYELGLEKPDPRRALWSALTIAGSYVAGGLIPLAPYMLVKSAGSALNWSVALTLVALAIFGYVKGKFAGVAPLRSALQTVAVGGLAAAAAFLIARAISG